MNSPVYNETHFLISEQQAIRDFDVLSLKEQKNSSSKISKSVFVDRWTSRKPDTSLCVIHNKRYLDLCWWNGKEWTYITTKLIK